MAQQDIGNKVPLHTLKTANEVKAFYDEWGSGGQYNKDMQSWNYTGPQETVSVFSRYALDPASVIFDAGCGSGLVGKELFSLGYHQIHGGDLSQRILDTVPTGLYRTLNQMDLNVAVDVLDDTFDAVLCVGTFTFGHVKSDALYEFIRITKNGGLIAFTVNEGVFISEGFERTIKSLEDEGKWQQCVLSKSNYMKSKGVSAWLGLFRVVKI
ncbi:MAG: class I SAM-dependent methyltransferase [Porticoccaceae bacterium]|nr:class I SAM-dependent methyltransferase [Porticoccaceae bacterium]MDG1474060.1 class I SAM-dependent methyltransferase [Porticoccaceae bacterium]